ncbi:MAG TPA: hypothetical protein VEQ10_09725 [Vicinamibacteria bacterium]|nr:hypothetical protein [Vicinamibacteria bacterium]
MRQSVLPCVLLALVGGFAAGVERPSPRLEVRAASGLVTMHCRTAPLSAVLDQLSRQTGLNVVYGGPRPSMPVSIDIEGLSEADALSRLLEGLGLDYAVQLDAAGSHVIAVLFTARTGALAIRPGTSPASGVPGQNDPFPHAPEPPPEPDEASDQSTEAGFPPGSVFENVPATEPAAPEPGPVAPPSPPAGPAAFGPGPVASGTMPTGPGGLPSLPPQPTGQSQPFPTSPFPGPTAPSFPTTASGPAPPVFPLAASNPAPN